MRLAAVRVFVRDLEAARGFYLDLLGLPLAWDMPELSAFGADAGGAQLIVETVEDPAEAVRLVGRFAAVSLAVDDIDGVYRDLTAKGVAFEAPPERQSWGAALANFRDPDGNVLTLLG